MKDGESGGDAGRGQPFNPWEGDGLAASHPKREPFSRSPWQPLVMAALLVGLYLAQTATGDADAAALGFSFTPADLWNGHFFGLFTALFVHGGWSHVLVNSVFLLAFGAPFARAVGPGWKGGVLFILFFLVCGVLGNLGYAVRHLADVQPLIGASGAIAGFYGAASRMLVRPGAKRDRAGLAPLTSPTVLAMGAAWVAGNLLVGLFGFNGGFGAPGASVAWEAHIAGYFAGLFLVGLFVRAARGMRA